VNSSSLRALGLVARRDITRHRLRSALVVALISLPVAAMVLGIALYRTTTPTQDRGDVAEMGRADLVAQNATREELQPYLPDGSLVEQVAFTDAHLVLSGTRPGVAVRGMDIDGLAAGMLTLVDGRTPKGRDEAAISDAVSKLAAVGIGGRIELDDGRSPTVVGIVENPTYLPDRVVLVDPSTIDVDPKSVMWLIGLPPGSDPESIVAASTNPLTGEQDVLIQSREGNETYIQFFTGGGVARTRPFDRQLLGTIRPNQRKTFNYVAPLGRNVRSGSFTARLLFRNLPPYWVRAMGKEQKPGLADGPQLGPLVVNLQTVEIGKVAGTFSH